MINLSYVSAIVKNLNFDIFCLYYFNFSIYL